MEIKFPVINLNDENNNISFALTKHRTFKIWHYSPCDTNCRIKVFPRREVYLGTASDYVLDRGGTREWKCDEGIRAAMWNGTAFLNRFSNVLKPPLAPLQPHIEDDCIMLLRETIVPVGWAKQVVLQVIRSDKLDAISKMQFVARFNAKP